MKFLRRLLPFFLLVLFLAAGGLLWVHHEWLGDTIVLRGYHAPQQISSLTDETAMTEYGKRLFFVNKPELNDKTLFNEHCQHVSTDAAVLGCFKGNRQGIYIFDVVDPRLNGIEQVTAAHEMLHQAYMRLDNAERKHIDQLLSNYYQNDLTDESVKSKMAIYQVAEPDNLANEMHSIFGTEIKDLPKELEDYYAQYFTDRQKVLRYRTMSQAAFDSYRQQIAAYDAQLAERQPHIDQMEVALTQKVAALKAAKAELEADLTAGRVGEYNAGVAPYNALVNSYNKDLATLNQRIAEFNKLVQERNEVSVEVSELNKALDSSLTPQ